MADNMSLGKLVQTIMESLGDAISGLVLQVLPLQESNADIPRNIVGGTEGVWTTSKNLADVAKGVAESEYGDYPDLQTPILNAAADVHHSSVSLKRAVENFTKNTSDRGTLWENYLEACRTISVQTVIILRLVYGAELEKVLKLSEALSNLAGTTTTSMDPMDFAERVSELADRASGVASYLAATESGARASQQLEKISEELPTLANHAINNPGNVKAKEDFDNKIKELQKEIENGTLPIKDLLRLQPETQIPRVETTKLGRSPNIMTPVAKASSAPTHPEVASDRSPSLLNKMQELIGTLQGNSPNDDVLAKMFTSISPILEKMLEDAAPSEEALAAEEIGKIADHISRRLDELLETADKPGEIDEIGNDIMRSTKNLVALCQPYAEKYLDPEQKKLFDAALDDLSALLPEIVKAAKECLSLPRPKRQQKLAPMVKQAQEILKYVRKPKPVPPTVPAAKLLNIKKGIRKIIDDGDSATPEDFRKLLENLKKIARDLVPPTEKGTPAAEFSKKIQDAIAELEKKLADKVKKGDNSPPWKTLPEIKKMFQDLAKEPAKDRVYDQVEEALPLLHRIAGAAPNAKKDPSKLVNATKAFTLKIKPILEAANEVANTEAAPEIKAAIKAAIAELEAQIPHLVTATKEVCQSPNQEAALNNLANVLAKIKVPMTSLQKSVRPYDLIEAARNTKAAIEAMLGKLAAANNSGNPQAAKEALAATKEAHSQFVKAAAVACEQAPESLKKDIQKNIAEVDLKFKNLASAVDGLAQSQTPENKERVSEKIRDLERALDKTIEQLEFVPGAASSETIEMARKIIAAIKSKTARKPFDSSHLLKISKELADKLGKMVNGTQVPGKAGSTEAVLESLGGMSLDRPGTHFQAETLLSKNIMKVVADMKAKNAAKGSADNSAVQTLTQGLASELQKFAEADSMNKKTDLVVLGRALCSTISKLAAELRKIANSCSDPRMKEKLLQGAQVLENQGTQLKIIASVRAASSKSNDTTTDQLSILTSNLGIIVAEAMNTIAIMKQTKRA